jgi:hypothetical protein
MRGHNQASRPFSSSRKYRMKYCPTHQVFYLSKYGHACVGGPVEQEPQRPQGWKRGRA